MAYSDVAIDVTAKQIEDAVKAVPELQEADETTSERLDELDQQMSQKVNYSVFRNNVEQLQTQIDDKQENLVAGNGVEIDGNVISALLDIAGTQGIEILDSFDEDDNPIKLVKLTEEAYNLIQQISNKENKLLSTDSNIELFETTDEFGNNVTGIQFGEQATNVVQEFGNLEKQVENKADKEGDYEVVYETTLIEATQSIVVDNLNLKKATIYISVPEATGTASLYVRINNSNFWNAQQVGFVGSAIKTTAQVIKVVIEKANGEIGAEWIVTTAESKYATKNGYAIEDLGSYVTSKNIEIIHLASTSSTHIFPIGTTFKIKGVQA